MRRASSDVRQPLLPLTAKQGRVIELAAEIAETAADNPFFQHAILCQVGLPRDRQATRRFERTSGNASIVVQAGELWDGQGWVEQPLPFGTKPRLALVRLATDAVRTRSRQIDIGRSTHDFMRMLGIDPNGRNYSSFRQQIAALAACSITLGFGDTTVQTRPVEKFSAWRAADSRPGTPSDLEPGVVELSSSFFESLCSHAVPLDPRAIAALQNSSLQLDLYTWLAHRLYRITRLTGERVSWKALQEQFGQEFSNPWNFKRKALEALKVVRAVYPEARLEEVSGALILLPSPPPVRRVLAI